CLVIILTKLFMACATFFYCQARFHIFTARDVAFPVCLASTAVCLFVALRPLITEHGALAVSMGVYCAILWKLGRRYMGQRRRAGGDNSSARP
ncbi:hypothetical protein ACFL0Q_03435, partial [Thermodesulfobacteriota bacterium]